MKVRTVITLSIVSLLAIVLIQLGGMFYAYHSQMKEAEVTLNKCFRVAFAEAIDNLVNKLPYEDGTIANIIWFSTPHNTKVDRNEFDWRGTQQTATVLQQAYGVKQISIAEIDTILHRKLQRAGMEGNTRIERIDIRTGNVTETTNSTTYSDLATVISQPAFSFKPGGEAVRAVIVFPFKEINRNILIMSGITFLFLCIAVFSLIMQIKMLVGRQSSLQEQQQDFYALAQEMRMPIGEMKQELSEQAWDKIEARSIALTDMTEKTLSKAKREVQAGTESEKRPFIKIIVWLALAGVALLLVVWSGYLYHIGYQKMLVKVEEHLEEAFYSETAYHRLKVFDTIYPESKKKERFVTPYVEQFYNNIIALCAETGYHYRLNYVVVNHKYGKLDESFALDAAYSLQDTIGNRAKVSIPFSLAYADSAFDSHLIKAGTSDGGDMQWMEYPSRRLIHYTGRQETNKWDMPTKLIPLDRDSTTCVRGIIRSPQKQIVSSIWYMLLPLGITFLFVCFCVFFQIRVLRSQRRLKQFQKDFAYSMIHDMKSPLQSLLMGAHILASGKLADNPGKIKKYRRAMEDECEHLLTLSNRVVMLTQLDRGELELHKEEVLLKPLLHDLVEKFQLRAVKQVHFQIHCEEECTAYADAFCLREVLSNLIDNAIKYSNKEVTVLLSGEVTAAGTFVTVRDNGIGIPLREQQRIFNKFERVSSGGRKTGASGFGLGLNYVMQVVTAHGGSVSLESVEGQYSEFTLCFPLSVE